MSGPGLDQRQAALLRLLGALDRDGYDFVTVTGATHRRLLERDQRLARDARDFLGWNRCGPRAAIGSELFDLLGQADMLEGDDEDGWRSRLRVSRVGGRLFLHSAFPTQAADAVFLGPDTYRFATLLARELAGKAGSASRIVDVGAGAGVGGVLAAAMAPGARVQLTDINPKALWLAAVNAAHNGVAAELIETSGLEGVTGMDLVIANPPFMAGDTGRTYSAGGDGFGAALSLAWADQALGRLRPGGRMILYTGSAIVDGEDRLKTALQSLAQARGAALTYEELDPDIFGNVLGQRSYAGVERIAAVAAVLHKPG